MSAVQAECVGPISPTGGEVVAGENGPEHVEHIHIPGCQWLAMKASGGGATDGIAGQDSFMKELLEDVADSLHDFLIFSNCRVSWMN